MVYISMVLSYARIGVQYDYKVFKIISCRQKKELKIDQNKDANSQYAFVAIIYGYVEKVGCANKKHLLIFYLGRVIFPSHLLLIN